MKVKLGLQLSGVVLDELKSTNLEYIDTTPFIQGVDSRNKIYVYINKEVYRNSYQTVSAVSISYLLQNGRSTIRMSNDSMTEETINSVVYKKYEFNLPTTATAVAGNIQATIYIRYGLESGQHYDFKYNVINTVIASNTIEILEDALSDTQSEILENLSDMTTAIQNVESNITDHNTRISALETDNTTNTNKIALLNTEAFGDSTGATQTNDGLHNIVRVIHNQKISALEVFVGNTENPSSQALAPRVSSLEEEVAALSGGSTTIMERVSTAENDIDNIENEIGTNFVAGKTITGRIKELEDADYQGQIDAINAGQNLADIVADLTALNNLSTTNIRYGDKVQVLVDSNHDNASTVYNYLGSWTYIGKYGQDGYTKAEENELLGYKVNTTTFNALNTAFETHRDNTNNPHNVTKSQIGLGNCDNTSDADKPISTATQAALDSKANQATTYTKTEVNTMISNLVINGYEIQWERLCDIFNEVYASDPLMLMLDTVNGEVI